MLNVRSLAFDVQEKQMIDDLTADEVRGLLNLVPDATCGFVRVIFVSGGPAAL
jgi:hypothetical protein